jgi:hypothetical protein
VGAARGIALVTHQFAAIGDAAAFCDAQSVPTARRLSTDHMRPVGRLNRLSVAGWISNSVNAAVTPILKVANGIASPSESPLN